MATDGLTSMFNANDQARRSARKVAPPRHPRKDRPTSSTAPTVDVIAAPDQPSGVAPAAATVQPPEAVTEPSTVARSVQLDEASEDLLDQVRTAGRRQRVDANRSATVRLALRRMREQLSPEQIAAELKKSQTDSKGAGRRII